ncbi:MAG: alkaline shock response membrane anchor protein AmaP [Bacillota bacterium]
MGVLDTIILTIYTICLAILSFLMVLYALVPEWIPLPEWIDSLHFGAGRVAVFLVGAAFFAVSLRLILMAFTRRGAGPALVHETPLGEVRIALSAVENLIRRVARGVRGVREVRATVTQGPGGLVAELRGVISPDVSIPEVSGALQEEVRACVRRVVGAEVTEVRVFVENIASDTRRRLD